MMKRLLGTAISNGIASSKVFLCNERELLIPSYILNDREIDDEIIRFHDACEVAKQELKTIKKESILASNSKMNAILDIQVLMLHDSEFLKTIETNVKESKQNVEFLLSIYFDGLMQKLENSKNPLMRERISDVKDLLHRILHVLAEVKGGYYQLIDLDEPAILVAQDMSPSLVMNLKKDLVKGIILEHGGRTSHAAILIRAMGFPAVFNVEGILQIVDEHTPIILDGNEGIVIVNPDSETESFYQKAIDYQINNTEYYEHLSEEPSITKDGVRITLRANAQTLADAIIAAQMHAEGIGLFRSEFVFLAQERKIPLSEEDQFHLYKSILEVFPTEDVVIRTLDLGADKSLPQFTLYQESNPLLGWRATRLCLAEKELFTNQLRALYRAALYGNLKIMFPFISSESELREVLEITRKVQDSLEKEQIPFKKNVPIGIMIETPSAVLISEQLAHFVDFFSIGTNDLTQYTLAVDRDNPKVAHYYKPIHKSILKLIQMTIDEARISKTNLSLCGELATDLIAVPLLLGMGLRELSVNPASLSHVKEVIRLTEIKEAKLLADNVFKTTRTSEIVELLKEYREKIFARKNY
ncbi:phosphoenolpyruvate--protein phosphotransferase [Entomospira nematocerorum]|uniref:Phosphoenolpyruvate-protein phosphotransferase n=1 Tax=Entomospira nematocerorum TaxID=2719987 RepID=A0A968GCZ5_9SPIO|nr:phosphoenolpyruvate--protein phosphotransferase [Entomospira nematocera]NIZ47572.1 phosphoenolpyruvate--protein phosphotransferase [Entomospira nematocera]WDI33889.1 phosphoenolpyruvate--protein phosphotransferase [Entomospira nematocera]